MHPRVLDCCFAISEQCECRASSIDSAVEGCAKDISFSRIEASSVTLDRRERLVSMAYRISPLESADGGATFPFRET